MKKTTNINLGGYPFVIDEDAYHQLRDYLSTINAHFSASEGHDDIMEDIEARMAELFQEALAGKKIVSQKELNTVIGIMGTPADFGVKEDIAEPEKKWSKNAKIKTGKRLFRDPDDQVIGGVCAGIAAYLGVSDPLWVRLIFVALTLSGMSIIVYVVFWAIVPEAKTSSDKLMMKGEAATVSNIAKMVESEIMDLSDKISELSKDLTGSKK